MSDAASEAAPPVGRRINRENAAFGLLCGCGVIILGLAAACARFYGPWGSEAILVGLFLVWGALTIVSCRVAVAAPARRALVAIIVVAVALRLIGLLYEPMLSTDIYRYIWDGRVQAALINPYQYVPADEALRALRDASIYPNINRADYAPTAYPPVAQMFFFAVTRLSETTVAMRLAFIACEIAIVWLLWDLLRSTGRPVVLIAAYAWHPLAAWEISNSGHVEALMVALFMAGVWLLVKSRRALAGVAMALAVLVKPYAVLALPAFWRPWDWRVPAAVAATVVLCYLPYIGIGTRALGFLPQYATEEALSSGDAFWPLLVVRRLIGDVPGLFPAYVAIVLAVLGALALRISFRGADWRGVRREGAHPAPDQSLRDITALIIAGLFFLSPNYPWYYLVLVPLIPLGGGAPAWTLTVLAPLLYMWWWPSEDPRFFLWKSVINVALLVALLVTVWRARSPDERSDIRG